MKTATAWLRLNTADKADEALNLGKAAEVRLFESLDAATSAQVLALLVAFYSASIALTSLNGQFDKARPVIEKAKRLMGHHHTVPQQAVSLILSTW